MTSSRTALRVATTPRGSKPLTPIRLNQQPDRIALVQSGTTHIVRLDQISHCEADSNYCRVVLENDRSILLSKSLKVLANALPGSDFIRVHQSFLIAKRFIGEVRQDSLMLTCGLVIPMSRSRRSEVIEAMYEMCITL